MKLNLGCNTRIRDGYVNYDKDKYLGVDEVGDVSDLGRYQDNSVEEIYASHILEHFKHIHTSDILKEWRRVLKPGGVLKISVPDFRRAVEIYLQTGMKDWIVYFLWGDQLYDGADHRQGFDEGRLRSYLEKAGFTDISVVETLPGSQPNECSNNISNIDRRLVSLNIVAVKE